MQNKSNSESMNSSPANDLLKSGRAAATSFGGILLAPVLVVAVALIVFFFADRDHLESAISGFRTQPIWLAILVGAYTAAFWIRAIAWRSLIGPSCSIYRLFVALQATLLANHILPFKIGELVRPVVAERFGVPLSRAIATSVVARLLDFSALICIAAGIGLVVSLSSDGGSLWMRGLALPAAALIAGAAALFAFRAKGFAALLPGPIRRRLTDVQLQLRQVSARRIGLAFLWTVPSWMLEAAVLLAIARVIGVELSIPAAMAITAFTILFQVFHFTPGGIGVYEGVMAGALYAHGIPFEGGLAIAALAHGLKFAYSYTISLALTLTVVRHIPALNPMARLRGTSDGATSASRFEIVAARLWNVLNEGKPFTPVFVIGVLVLISLPNGLDGAYWTRAGIALLVIAPIFLLFYRYDFPLKLRIALWVFLGVFFAAFRFVDPVAVLVILGLYLTFTVFLWGTVYYHLRIGTPWTNFTRFWRLVLENPDPTSGNFLEQVPKTLLLISAFGLVVERPGLGTILGLELFVVGMGIATLLVHQWFFTWPPAPSLAPTRTPPGKTGRRCKKFIAIVIDGCRADRFLEADTPFLDRLRREGADYMGMTTVYPARTVTCFSSMLTGAPPKVHGMRSNFVTDLGVKCESVFDSLASSGMKGKLVGIAHLVDAFGHRNVETVTAVTHNDDIDDALAARARLVLEREDPELLVLQLLSVDQTGHARGSYNSEYLAKIEEADRIIEDFIDWCEKAGYMEDATVLVTADHGQGLGIGGHGHMSPTEIEVPCILWGAGVEEVGRPDHPRSIMDIGPTITHYLGIAPPAQSVGQVLGIEDRSGQTKPVAVIIPAHNEAENLPDTLARIPREAIPNVHVIVVDDGSTDGTSDVARLHGAETVIQHPVNRGLGAALRTGIIAARELDPRAAVYVDADGEYPPEQIPDLLAPILDGNADYVLGSRYKGTVSGQPLLRRMGNLVFTGLLCLAAGRRITDGQTGFRAFSRRALDSAEIIHDYNYAQVLTLDLLKKGMRMKELPISYTHRTLGKSFINAKYLWHVPIGMIRQLVAS